MYTINDLVDDDIDWFAGAPLGKLVYDRTYARVKEDGNKESWPETARRVVDGNTAFVPEQFIEPGEREDLFQLLLNRQLIPAGRHLWVTGVPGRSFTQNCHVAGFETGFAEHCGFVFGELMKGGGVGANYSSRYLSALTPLSGVAVRFTCSPEHADFDSLLPLLQDNARWNNHEWDDPDKEEYLFLVPDSREGWVRSLEILIEFAQRADEFALVFDVSEVRCAGSPIRGFGGTASGPLPLITMLRAVADLLPSAVTPELAMEIDHLIAAAVIAGNVRRSARMSLMHWADEAISWFLNCKADHMHHWSTNISVEVDNDFFRDLLDPESLASAVYERVIDGMLRDGEPGFFNSSLASEGERTHLGATNPCGEMPLESWESCNLGHVNLAFGTDEDHRRAFRLMARFLIRSSFCDIQDPKQRAVVDRNRRIGVGFFGLQEWLGLRSIRYSEFGQHGILADALTEWYAIVREEADSYADQLGINRPIKCTTLAPTGTIAKLAGTSESMQCIYAKYIIRRVRYSDTDPELANLLARNIPLEPDLYTPRTLVASFPCEDPILSRVPGEYVEEQHEISITTLLELQAMIQRYYADNAISLTVNVPQATLETYTDVRDTISEAIKKYLPHVKGCTVFPEASRPQSPIEKITAKEYDLLIEKIAEAQISAGSSDILLEDCVGGACPVR